MRVREERRHALPVGAQERDHGVHLGEERVERVEYRAELAERLLQRRQPLSSPPGSAAATPAARSRGRARGGAPRRASARRRWRPAAAWRRPAAPSRRGVSRRSRVRSASRSNVGRICSDSASGSLASARPPKVCSSPVTVPWSARSSADSDSSTAPVSRTRPRTAGRSARTVSVICSASSRKGPMLPSPSERSMPRPRRARAPVAERLRVAARVSSSKALRISSNWVASSTEPTPSSPPSGSGFAASASASETLRRRAQRDGGLLPAAGGRLAPRRQLDVGLALQGLLADDRARVGADRRVLRLDLELRGGRVLPVDADVGRRQLDRLHRADGDAADPHVGLDARATRPPGNRRSRGSSSRPAASARRRRPRGRAAARSRRARSPPPRGSAPCWAPASPSARHPSHRSHGPPGSNSDPNPVRIPLVTGPTGPPWSRSTRLPQLPVR